jgi:hypothetical protein
MATLLSRIFAAFASAALAALLSTLPVAAQPGSWGHEKDSDRQELTATTMCRYRANKGNRSGFCNSPPAQDRSVTADIRTESPLADCMYPTPRDVLV